MIDAQNTEANGQKLPRSPNAQDRAAKSVPVEQTMARSLWAYFPIVCYSRTSEYLYPPHPPTRCLGQLPSRMKSIREAGVMALFDFPQATLSRQSGLRLHTDIHFNIIGPRH